MALMYVVKELEIMKMPTALLAWLSLTSGHGFGLARGNLV